METQQLLDALTDHLAIYHRSSAPKTESRERQRVVEWLAGLNYEQRQAALTVVDGPWVSIILSMQKYLIAEDRGSFFLLPDVPCNGREGSGAEVRGPKSKKGKVDENSSQPKGTRPSIRKLHQNTATKAAEPSDRVCNRCSSTLPGLCFRRARGLVRRLPIEQTAGDLLVNSVRLFSSGDGEAKVEFWKIDTSRMLDCMSLSDELIRNVDTFLGVMDDLSNHEFLKSPCHFPVSSWEEMPWLKDMGYYSLAAFIANKFEFGLLSAWRYAQGNKVQKPSRSIALKLKETQGGRNVRGCSCEQHSNAAVASNIIGRKVGCIDWWSRLGKQRTSMIKCTLALACKSEVLRVVGEARGSSSKARNLNVRGKNKILLADSGETRSRDIFKASLSDTEAEQHVMLGRRTGSGAAVAPLFAGLQALKELAESGLLCGRSEGMNPVQEADASWLFDSKLKSAHTLSDRVLRKVRNVLVKVRNDRVELELFGDENNSHLHSSNGGEGSGVKSTKTKKKRRKHSSSNKLDVMKQEEKMPGCKLAPSKEQEVAEKLAGQKVEANVHIWTSEAQQLMDGSKSLSTPQQPSMRKGKGVKCKSTKDDKLHHESKLHSRMSSMTGNEDLNASALGNMDGSYATSVNGKGTGEAPNERQEEQLDHDSSISVEKSHMDFSQVLPTCALENGNGFHLISSNRRGKGSKSKSKREDKMLTRKLMHKTDPLSNENEGPNASKLETMNGVTVHVHREGEAGNANLEIAEKLLTGFIVPFGEDILAVKDHSNLGHVEDSNGGSGSRNQGKDWESNGIGDILPVMGTINNSQGLRDRPEHEEIDVHHDNDERNTSLSSPQIFHHESATVVCNVSSIENVDKMNVDPKSPNGLSPESSRIWPCSNAGSNKALGIRAEQTATTGPSGICFGTVNTVLARSPELPNHSPLPIFLKVATSTKSNLEKGKKASEKTLSRGIEVGMTQAMDLGNCSEGASYSRHIRDAPNGLYPPTKTSRQLEFASNGVSHDQQGHLVRSWPHEWPGSVQISYSGAYSQPTATDWLQLDVGRGWLPHMDSSLITYRSNPAPMARSVQAETSASETASQSIDTVSQDWPSLAQSSNVSPTMALTVPSTEESQLNGRPFMKPSTLSSGSGSGEVEGNGGTGIDEFEIEDRFAYDTDVDDYGVYKAGEFEDFDGYMVSEEEGERSLEDITDSSAADYNQIFGGGVMYWNAADYAGMGYSRPGSLSSEDSSFARHEADLSAVLDDIVHYQLLQAGYPGKGPPVASSSPPSASSLPISFDHLSPVASTNSRHGLPRPAGSDFPGKFPLHANQVLNPEDQSGVSRVASSLDVIDMIRADSSGQPMLRPLVVARDLSLSRQLSSGEALRLQEAKSPSIVPRSRRDFPGHRKRPPSPVLRCVPPAPPPPPPSPVAGPRRRKGFMAARSGSSSPRHWGLVNWSYKDEPDGLEGKAKGGSPEGLLGSGRRRVCVTSTPPMHPLPGALLRERLISVPPLALEQEHPDLAFSMKTTVIQSSSPGLVHTLPKLLKAIHLEIEAFRFQVAKENKRRKPFVNTAVKKVAHSLQVLWPRSRTKIFGSIATGLALPTSDVDLVVCLPPVRNLEPIKEAGILEGRNGIKETCLQHAARYLADQDWVKNDSLKTIENTLVPIIILVAEFLPHQCDMEDEDSPYSFGPDLRKDSAEDGGGKVTVAVANGDACKEEVQAESALQKGLWGGKADRQLVRLDISFEAPSHTGLRTAELVRELIGQFPALSPLALVLKQFLTDRSLDHPYTGGLSSYCLVLLITRFLQHQTNLLHTGRQTGSQNLGSLFVDFLHFFGCVFDPRRMGVRIRGGGMYVSRDRFHGIDPLYIEDPLHPDNNVGRNCFRILQCVKAFADAYAVLEKKIHEVPNIPVDRVSGTANFELLQTILPGLVNT